MVKIQKKILHNLEIWNVFAIRFHLSDKILCPQKIVEGSFFYFSI